ncbi:MAG: hypothetical protein C6Y22_30640 [Hapalosiphonaceae cyanobacterium JJU2]|nr:MAG: hypothetical protein C6Y22_30640 [Hapalosiphonaceae cyanobacterium JJU2]
MIKLEKERHPLYDVVWNILPQNDLWQTEIIVDKNFSRFNFDFYLTVSSLGQAWSDYLFLISITIFGYTLMYRCRHNKHENS